MSVVQSRHVCVHRSSTKQDGDEEEEGEEETMGTIARPVHSFHDALCFDWPVYGAVYACALRSVHIVRLCHRKIILVFVINPLLIDLFTQREIHSISVHFFTFFFNFSFFSLLFVLFCFSFIWRVIVTEEISVFPSSSSSSSPSSWSNCEKVFFAVVPLYRSWSIRSVSSVVYLLLNV